MITFKEKATITKGQHQLLINVEDEVPEGEYEIEVILKEEKNSQRGILNFPVSNINIPLDSTFSHEEIYGDDGR